MEKIHNEVSIKFPFQHLEATSEYKCKDCECQEDLFYDLNTDVDLFLKPICKNCRVNYTGNNFIHEYNLKDLVFLQEFDFIFSSPPCPTHSVMMKINCLNPYKDNSKQITNGGGKKIIYPEMELYQEIILLNMFV